jgi:hypothetical protein
MCYSTSCNKKRKLFLFLDYCILQRISLRSVFKKGKMHNCCRHSIKDLRSFFSPWRKFEFTKQYLHQRHTYNQQRPATLKIATWCSRRHCNGTRKTSKQIEMVSGSTLCDSIAVKLESNLCVVVSCTITICMQLQVISFDKGKLLILRSYQLH